MSTRLTTRDGPGHPALLGLLLALYLGAGLVTLWRSPGNASNLHPTDALEYAQAAERFVETGRYEITLNSEPHPPRYPPGFSVLFLAPVYLVVRTGLGAGILPVLASALIVLAAAWHLCRKVLGGFLGASAAFVMLFALLEMESFYKYSRVLMSDIPTLALGTLVLICYYKAEEGGGTRSFFLGGVITALAFMTRYTSLAFALPFAAMLAFRPVDGRWGKIAALGTPILLGVGAMLLYNQQAFGDPFYSGYQYWLAEPGEYLLSPSHVFTNLVEFLNPFMAAEHLRSPAAPFLAPLFWAFVAAAAGLCRARRPAGWAATAPLRRFVLLAGLPILVFHLFYPFHSARFVLVFHGTVLLCTLTWAFALADRLPKPLLAAFIPAALWASLEMRPPDPEPREKYVHWLCRTADRALPEDALFIACRDLQYLEVLLLRGTERRILPLDSERKMASLTVGKAGGPRKKIFDHTASGSKDRIEGILRSGRRVFMDLPHEFWMAPPPALQALQERFDVVPLWWWPITQDALAEVKLKEPF